MLVRVGACLVVCSLTALAGQQLKLSGPQGTRAPLAQAFSSAFNPLGLKTAKPNSGADLKLLAASALARSMQTAAPCSIPLARHKITDKRQFFILTVKPPQPDMDKAMILPAPSPVCEERDLPQ